MNRPESRTIAELSSSLARINVLLVMTSNNYKTEKSKKRDSFFEIVKPKSIQLQL